MERSHEVEESLSGSILPSILDVLRYGHRYLIKPVSTLKQVPVAEHLC